MASSKKSSKNNQKTSAVFYAISRWCLRLTVVAVLLVFTTRTNDALELTKFVVLAWLVVIGVVSGLIGVMLDKTWSWRPTPLLWYFVVWNAGVVMATIFSLNRTVSFWGETGYWHHGLVAMWLFSILYVWVQQLADRRLITELIWWFVGALSAVGIFIMLQLRGIYLFPQSVLHNASFNPLSVSLSLAAVLLAVALLISIGFGREATNRFSRIMAIGTMVISGVTLILIDRSLGWYALIAGLLAFLIVSARKRDTVRWGLTINGLLVIAVVGLLVPIPNALVSDISLTTATSQQVTTETIKHHALVGTGPGTWLYDFSSYRPTEFNQSLLWDSRFIKAGNDWWQLTATTGILGLLGWLALQIGVIRFLWQRFRREAQSPLAMGMAAAWCTLLVVTLLFPSSLVSWFAYWLVLAAVVALVREEKATRTASGNLRTFASFFLAIFLIGGGLALMVTTRLWLGNYNLTRAQVAINKLEDLDIVEGYFSNAVRYLPHDPMARFALAQNKIIRVQVGVTNQTMDEEEASDLLQEAIQDGEAALALAPRRAESYETLIILYGQVNAITGQATGPSILDLQEKLMEIEPNHPRHYADLGLSYVARSEALRASSEDLDEQGKAQMTKDLTDALAAFEKSRTLRADYPTATLGVIRVKQLQNETAEAIAIADEAMILFADDPSSLYTIGTLYNALDAKDKAEQAYGAALRVAPEDVTILLALAQLAEGREKLEDARSYYERVLAVDAENETAKTRLEALSQ